MERPLAIDCLSIFGMPPVPFVELAAELGCAAITLGIPVTCNPENYPAYSFADKTLQREVKAALRANGVTLHASEGYFVLPGVEAAAYADNMDIARELGATCVNMLSMDPDMDRTLDQFAILAEMAAARGMTSSVEFVAGLTIGTIAAGVAAVRHVGRPDFKLVVDTMHVGRSGGTAAELAAIDPATIGYIQICDCTIVPQEDAAYEVTYDRMRPGAGELPLRDMLAALPRAPLIGIEVPQRRLAEAGVSARERLAACVDATRAVLATI